jgi:hypothetical protein
MGRYGFNLEDGTEVELDIAPQAEDSQNKPLTMRIRVGGETHLLQIDGETVKLLEDDRFSTGG